VEAAGHGVLEVDAVMVLKVEAAGHGVLEVDAVMLVDAL
jgi:hypothetical protein